MAADDGNAEIVRRWFARLQKADPAPELCDPEIEIRNVEAFPDTGPYHGHDGLRRWWEDLADAIEEMRVELREVEELDAQRFLTVQRLVGRFRATGIGVDAEWASVITVRRGLIAGATGHWSRSQALRAAGLE